jgi:hypothetical protein
MRVLPSAALAALQGRSLPLAVLVEMALSSPLNLNTASLDLTLNGTTYYGTKGLGSIDPIPETPAEVRALKFTLSGVPVTSIALALTEPVQGKLVTIKLAIFDPATYQVLDVRTRWAGRLDVFTLDDGGATGTLTVTAEHAGIDLTRPGNLLYTDASQQSLVPGDYALQFLNDQVEQRIVWPSASWGKQG